MQEPTYLQRDYTNEDTVIQDDEIILRRVPKSVDNLFLYVRTNDFKVGVSCNRERLMQSPLDILWNSHIESGECEYEDVTELNRIIFTTVNILNESTHDDGRFAYIDLTPLPCNVAHCDILFNPGIADLTKKEITRIKLYLTTLFTDYN